MRIRCLADLKRPEPGEVTLAALPQEILVTRYARDKAFKISELVRTVHQDSFEWYGFTLGSPAAPEVILDIGLPRNSLNVLQYASLTPENIAAYQESLDRKLVINGWIHSHGSLEHREFSSVDEGNQLTVLDYVTSRLRQPVAKKEVAIKDLIVLVKGQHQENDLKQGSVTLITDVPVKEARLLETIYGGFCYAIVIGDEGWHRQEIHYKRRGILSGLTEVDRRTADMVVTDTGRILTDSEVENLREEVKHKIRPVTNPPPENIERM